MGRDEGERTLVPLRRKMEVKALRNLKVTQRTEREPMRARMGRA